MKKIAIVFVAFVLFPFYGISQTIENIDFISPYNDGLAAIQKGDEWAFINTQGDIVIDFREDLVLTISEDVNYPVFNKDRCLIQEQKEGITYFGFIDKTGEAVIAPQFLNATNFSSNGALVIELVRTELGNNDMLKKPMVNYGCREVIIDANGNIVHYLTKEPRHITLSKDYMVKPPEITSKLISNDVFAVWTNDDKWEIKKIELW